MVIINSYKTNTSLFWHPLQSKLVLVLYEFYHNTEYITNSDNNGVFH